MNFYYTQVGNVEGGLRGYKLRCIFGHHNVCACECSLRRRMHPGALFLCAQAGCGKRFKTRNAVELHRSTVGHGETPFRIVGSSPPPDKGCDDP